MTCSETAGFHWCDYNFWCKCKLWWCNNDRFDSFSPPAPLIVRRSSLCCANATALCPGRVVSASFVPLADWKLKCNYKFTGKWQRYCMACKAAKVFCFNGWPEVKMQLQVYWQVTKILHHAKQQKSSVSMVDQKLKCNYKFTASDKDIASC